MRQITFDLDDNNIERVTIGTAKIVTSVAHTDVTALERVAELRGETPNQLLDELIWRSIHGLREAYQSELEAK